MFIEIVSGSASNPSGSITNVIASLYPNIGNGQQNSRIGSMYRDDRDGSVWMRISGSVAQPNAWTALLPTPLFGSAAPSIGPVPRLTGSLYFQI